MAYYSNIISLGFFCSVASELERVGLRSASYPFDWLISDFEGVVKAIESHFEDFLNYDNMAQYEMNPSFYKDQKYKMQFYHDFDECNSLKKQLPKVKEKYGRRIERFYSSIKNPTLFLRYIESQDEVEWIERNLDRINSLFCSFNDKNSIIWIANSEIKSKHLPIFSVEKDDNDSVARTFLESNKELKQMLESIDFSNRESNLVFFNRKQNKTKKKNYKNILIRKIRKPYSHTVKYS